MVCSKPRSDGRRRDPTEPLVSEQTLRNAARDEPYHAIASRPGTSWATGLLFTHDQKMRRSCSSPP